MAGIAPKKNTNISLRTFIKNRSFSVPNYFSLHNETTLIMDKIYYLASCDTCRKIIKSLPKDHDFKFHDIKQDPITVEELEQMRELSGSYESLFSKKAQLYKSMDLKNKALTEEDYKKYILEHYTFLSRPVFIINNKIYIGNTQQNMHQVMLALGNV
ncbi:arsenate reductase [Flavobacterium sp. PL12]